MRWVVAVLAVAALVVPAGVEARYLPREQGERIALAFAKWEARQFYGGHAKAGPCWRKSYRRLTCAYSWKGQVWGEPNTACRFVLRMRLTPEGDVRRNPGGRADCEFG